ncbi:MAG TPA: peptide ABC transporter substrate-binding protein [Candidatus Paceibacterota bacterium]|nr:peptide ABC transporter substrate-binding protein [Candidatus Paceibacterota bacterium]
MTDPASLWEKLTRSRAVAVFERFERSLKALPPGDKLVGYCLLALVAAAAILAFHALEARLLVRVPAEGGTLTEGELGSPQFVNPLLAVSDADRDLAALTYAGLMGRNGSGDLVPVLASSYTVSPDGKTYTFTLRPDATFSDGTPVTAQDVVFTVEKAQDPALKSPEYADWSGVAAAALDAHTVSFTLAKPYAPFLEDTTLGILPARLWQGVSDAQFPFSNLAIQPVAAGPFKVGRVVRNASGLIQSYTLVANPDYVLGRPYLDSIRFVFYDQQEDLARALAAGAVESAYGIPAADAGGKTLTAPYSRVFGVFFNPGDNAVLARPEVREALSLALDRSAIVADSLGGYATAIMGPVPPGSGIAETPVPQTADPIAAAAQVLARAGWSYDGDRREWVNAAAKLTLGALAIKTSNVPELKSVAVAVESEWEKLGIATDVELYEPGDLTQNVIKPRKYDALLFGMVIGSGDDLYPFWDSTQKSDPGLNIADYADSTTDALLEDARSNDDAQQRLDDLAQIESRIAAAYPAAFVYAPEFLYAVPARLEGVALPQISVPADRFASAADWYLRTEAVWPFLATSSK